MPAVSRRAVASLTVPGGQNFHFPHFSSNFNQFDLFFLKIFSFSSSFWLSGLASCPPGKTLATQLVSREAQHNHVRFTSGLQLFTAGRTKVVYQEDLGLTKDRSSPVISLKLLKEALIIYLSSNKYFAIIFIVLAPTIVGVNAFLVGVIIVAIGTVVCLRSNRKLRLYSPRYKFREDTYELLQMEDTHE